MNFERGDVLLVTYHVATVAPRRQTKTRPMVVVSGETFHTERPQDILAALVTTKVEKYRGKTDYALQDWKAAGLFQPSTVRTTLATIERVHIGGKVGRLTDRDMQGVDRVLRRALSVV